MRSEPLVSAKRGKKNLKIHGVRALMRADFPRARYAQRSLIETVFCDDKRKLSCRVAGKPYPLRSLRPCCSASLITSIASECPVPNSGC